MLLSTPYKDHKSLLEDGLTTTEDGGHVRYGYSEEEIMIILRESGLGIVKLEYIGGYISQQLTNLTKLLDRVNPFLSWIIVLPLRLLQLIGERISILIDYPYLSIGIIGERREQ